MMVTARHVTEPVASRLPRCRRMFRVGSSTGSRRPASMAENKDIKNDRFKYAKKDNENY
jgi:hypothetical protein